MQQRLRVYDSLSWHCDQIRINLKRGNLVLAEAHARAVKNLCKVILIQAEREIIPPIVVESS